MKPALPEKLLACLACPFCRGSLIRSDSGYSCLSCDKQFPLVGNVLRFVDSQIYAGSFGYQWEKYSITQLMPDASERHFRKKTGLREEDLRGKLVLDVGCGTGRFAEVATRWGATVVGIDLSAAAEVAARNLAGRDFTAVQADVFALPFKIESFDCIYSIGVLHHTPDCERAFKNLPQYLKPNGKIAVWLYSGYNDWYRFSDQYRKFTHRMPIERLHRFLQVTVPLFYWLQRGLRTIPFAGRPAAAAVNHLFPISPLADPAIRVLDTLDWYSPQYQSKHTYEQVFRWFESCNMHDLSVGNVPISVNGRKFDAGHAANDAVTRLDGGRDTDIAIFAKANSNSHSFHGQQR